MPAAATIPWTSPVSANGISRLRFGFQKLPSQGFRSIRRRYRSGNSVPVVSETRRPGKDRPAYNWAAKLRRRRDYGPTGIRCLIDTRIVRKAVVRTRTIRQRLTENRFANKSFRFERFAPHTANFSDKRNHVPIIIII